MGAVSINYADVRGSACLFSAAGYKKSGNAAYGWVLASGYGRNSLIWSGDTAGPDICGQATGNSGIVGGHTAYF